MKLKIRLKQITDRGREVKGHTVAFCSVILASFYTELTELPTSSAIHAGVSFLFFSTVNEAKYLFGVGYSSVY